VRDIYSLVIADGRSSSGTRESQAIQALHAEGSFAADIVQQMCVCVLSVYSSSRLALLDLVELIDTRKLTNTAKHRLTQTDTGVSISWTGGYNLLTHRPHRAKKGIWKHPTTGKQGQNDLYRGLGSWWLEKTKEMAVVTRRKPARTNGGEHVQVNVAR
jgi:hypothetical protein